ncbi:MAG: hypothetical protein MUQ00_04080 [Candidatus Aminicenantes bacterium]|nr:hypothetical protein [Candidatus Aminicenantes bacterium]
MNRISGFGIVSLEFQICVKEQSPFVAAPEDQAKLMGIPIERAKDPIVMRLDLV